MSFFKGVFSKKFFSFLLCLFVAIMSLYIKSRASSKEEFRLPQYKSLCLYQRHQNGSNVCWKSSNENVAVVDKNGIVYGKNLGKVVISCRGDFEKDYNVDVIERDYILGSSISPKTSGNFKITVVTNENVKKIKLIFKGRDISTTSFIENHENSSGYFVWHTNSNVKSDKSFTVTAYAQVGCEWITNSVGFMDYDAHEKRVSDRGIDFITSCEGYRSKYYFCVANCATVGYGKQIGFGMTFQNNLCEALAKCEFLNEDLRLKEKQVNCFLSVHGLECNHNQFDALVSFTYNISASWMYSSDSRLRKLILNSNSKNLNFVDKDEFEREYLMYHHAAKKCVSGLLARRLQELDMFFYGEYSQFLTFKKYKNSHKHKIPECFSRYYENLKKC